ncbi:MAG: hypothetical protein ACXV5H_00290 [Halobacteriota archaeon]
MNRKYFAALFIVAVVLIVFRVGYSLVQWGDSQDPDPWKVLGDTNKYVMTGHYSPSSTQSTYYGAYSVGLQAVLAALSVFTGVDLITLALYFLQIATPLVMVIVAYIITSRSGKDTTLVIPVMILLVGSFLGNTRQQSRMIEENVGFILFCGALLFLYLYYNKRASRRLTFSMLTIILVASIFTHHISFLMIALLAMPFLVLKLKYAAPAYIAAIFVPWLLYYDVINGYNGPYVGIFFYTILALAILYAAAALCLTVFRRSKTTPSVTRLLTLLQQVFRTISNAKKQQIAALTLIVGAVAVIYSIATRLQSGYVPFFLPLAPLVLYAGACAVTSEDQKADQFDVNYTRYLIVILILLSLATAIGFILQSYVSGVLTSNTALHSIEGLASVDLGSRFTTWVAFIYGLIATIGLVLVGREFHISKRWLAPSLIAMLLILASINTVVLAVNYDASFAITSPPDSRVIAAAQWTVGKDPDNATMTDYKNEMVYWYYAGALVTYTPLTEVGNLTVLDYVYPNFLQMWNGSGHTGINYLLITATPEKFYYEHLFNGNFKLSSQNAMLWQKRVAAIDNGAQATIKNYTNSYDKIYTNGFSYYYKVVEV